MSVTFESGPELLESFTCYTLVDMTNTGVNDPGQALPYQQNQNLNTLVQCLGLRSQPLMLEIHKMEGQDLSAYSFGKKYKKGRANIWRLRWKSDRPGYFTTELLKADASGLPIHANLEETVDLSIHVLETQDKNLTNTYFQTGD